MSETEYLVNQDLGDNGGILRASTIEELDQWVQKERAFWGWLTDPELRQSKLLNNISAHVNNILQQLHNNMSNWKAGTDTASAEFQNVIDRQYRPRTLLHSSTPEAGFM